MAQERFWKSLVDILGSGRERLVEERGSGRERLVEANAASTRDLLSR